MQNVENPHRASLLAGTVLRCLERLQIGEVERFYIFNDALSIMEYPCQDPSTPKATNQPFPQEAKLIHWRISAPSSSGGKDGNPVINFK